MKRAWREVRGKKSTPIAPADCRPRARRRHRDKSAWRGRSFGPARARSSKTTPCTVAGSSGINGLSPSLTRSARRAEMALLRRAKQAHDAIVAGRVKRACLFFRKPSRSTPRPVQVVCSPVRGLQEMASQIARSSARPARWDSPRPVCFAGPAPRSGECRGPSLQCAHIALASANSRKSSSAACR